MRSQNKQYNVRSFTDFLVLVCFAKNVKRVFGVYYENSYYGQLSCRARIKRIDSINAAASKTRLVHNMQGVCSREYMRNYSQYDVHTFVLTCSASVQFKHRRAHVPETYGILGL